MAAWVLFIIRLERAGALPAIMEDELALYVTVPPSCRSLSAGSRPNGHGAGWGKDTAPAHFPASGMIRMPPVGYNGWQRP